MENNAGEIIIKTEIDNSDVDKGIKEVKNKSEEMTEIEKQIAEAKKKTLEYEKETAEAKQRTLEAQQKILEYEQEIANSEKSSQIGEGLQSLIDKYGEYMGRYLSLMDKSKGTLIFESDVKEAEMLKEGIREVVNEIEKMTGQKIKIAGIDEANVEANRLKEEIEKIGKSVKKVTKSIAKWGLTLMGLSGIFSFIRSSISTISQQDKELANDIQYIRTALAYSLEPVVRWIVNLMKQLLILIGGIIKLLFGRNIFEETNKGLENANKQAKDLKKQLAGFDEMNVLSDTSNSGGGSTEGFDPGLVNNMADEIEKGIGMWEQFGAEMKQATDLSFDDWIDAFGKLGIAVEGVTLFVYGLWEIVDGFFTFLIGIFNILKGVITGDTDLIWQGIVEMLDGLWEVIDGFINIVAGLVNTLVGLVVALVISLGEMIWEILKGLWDLIWNLILTGFSLIEGIFTTLIEIVKAPFVILWETVKTVFNGIKTTVQGVFNVIKGLFTGDMKTVMNGFKQIFKGAFDALWGIVKAPLNLVIEGINALIKGINKISFDVPDWVPIIGGQKWGFKIPKIPKLAKGGIVNNPGKGVMMGSYIAGERAPEAVIPLDDDTLDRLGLAFARHTQINATVPVYVGNRQIAREIRKINAEDDFAYNGG